MSYTNYTYEIFEKIRRKWGVDPVNAESENDVLNIIQDVIDDFENEISSMSDDIVDLERQLDALQ